MKTKSEFIKEIRNEILGSREVAIKNGITKISFHNNFAHIYLKEFGDNESFTCYQVLLIQKESLDLINFLDLIKLAMPLFKPCEIFFHDGSVHLF